MTSVTKNPHLPSKNFFRMQTRRPAASFQTFTRSVEHTGPENFCAKPCAFRHFFRKSLNPSGRQRVKLIHCHTHAELFCNISLHGERTRSPIVIILFCSFNQNFICCLHLLNYDKIKYIQAFLRVTPGNASSFPLKLYFCKEFLIERCDSQPQKLWSHYLNKILVKCCTSKISFLELSS